MRKNHSKIVLHQVGTSSLPLYFVCELLLKTNNQEKLIGEDWHITNTNRETAGY